MIKSQKIFYIVTLLLVSPCLDANDLNFWICTSFDSNYNNFFANNSYKMAALNEALSNCKKSSKLPNSCKVAKENCEYFVNGLSTKPLWQCTALDAMAHVWLSNFYQNRDDAALAAKAYCEEKSGFADTCYVNLMTCKNLQEIK